MTREERAYNYASKKNPSKFTVGEIAKHYDDGYADGYKDAIDKACEFMESCVGYVVSGEKCNYENFIKYMNNLEE